MSKLLVDEISDADNTGPVTVTDGLNVSSGNVGIGTSSPDRVLHLNNSGTEQNVRAKFTNGTTGEGASDGFEIGINASNPAEVVLVNYEASPMAFFTSATERMRIDSSGNLLVGKTSNSFGTTGVALNPDGSNNMTRSSDPALALNRLSSDGAILGLYKDGATVGSIGTEGGYTKIIGGNGSVGSGLGFFNLAVNPRNAAGSLADGTISLGEGSNRFKDLYLSGGVNFGAAGGTGTSTSNLLDDYEEGTFVPTLGGTTTYTGAAGFYTKVGQIVWVTCYVNIASLNTPKNGNHYIQGLPFAASGLESYMGVHYFYNCAVNMSYLAFRATGYDMWPTFAGSPSASMGVNPAIFQNNTQVYIAGVYRTAQ